MKKHLRMNRFVSLAITVIVLTLLLVPSTGVQAMHIMEGFLPSMWCVVWGVVALPFVIWGLMNISKIIQDKQKNLLLLALVGAYVFVLSAMKIPSVTGSCSHPTGTGLAAILFGPAVTAVLGLIVLLFQAILLAHGGLTTLGANLTSMGIAGPILSLIIYRLIVGNPKTNTASVSPKKVYFAVFLASALGDLFTYVVTSIQLAMAYPDPATHSALASFQKFASIFAITQIPLAIIEGILTAMIFSFITTHNRDQLIDLNVLPKNMTAEAV